MWLKGIAKWKIKDVLYLSIPFTWLLPEGKKISQMHKGKTIVGGPAAYLMEGFVSSWAKVQREVSFVNPLNFHNPLATFTSRGCIRKCQFCAVPIIEGDLKELPEWQPRPIICDNNFLATSKQHIKKVIDSLTKMPIVDFNQGLDVRLLKKWHLDQFTRLKQLKLRFAFDSIDDESRIYDAIVLSNSYGFKDISVYVLLGYNDSPEEAKYKLEKIREWGARPNPMRYQPLDSLQKNSYIHKNWTEKELAKMTKYYFRLNWTSKVPYDEFNYREEIHEGFFA